jgi:hypothetical protein
MLLWMTFPVSVMGILLSWEAQVTKTILVLRTDNRDLVSRLKSGAGPSLAAIQLVCGPSSACHRSVLPVLFVTSKKKMI